VYACVLLAGWLAGLSWFQWMRGTFGWVGSRLRWRLLCWTFWEEMNFKMVEVYLNKAIELLLLFENLPLLRD
jgi:hypothetical protein